MSTKQTFADLEIDTTFQFLEPSEETMQKGTTFVKIGGRAFRRCGGYLIFAIIGEGGEFVQPVAGERRFVAGRPDVGVRGKLCRK